MAAQKHLMQFLSILYDSPKAMGIEEFARGPQWKASRTGIVK